MGSTVLGPHLDAEVPGEACGKKKQSLTLPIYAKISKKLSQLAKQAEQEHCNDFGYAFDQTVGKWAIKVNKLAASGKVYGPVASREKCKALIEKDLGATLTSRLKAFAVLAAKTDIRDQKGYHSFTLDFNSDVEIRDKCTKLVVGVSKTASTKIGVVPSKEIIK
jgi:hypothetical protein